MVKKPDTHIPVTPPSDEFRKMQNEQRARQRATVRETQPTVNRINRDQIKGGARPSKA